MNIKPFQALRPQPEYANRVASAPYDTMSHDEAVSLASKNPLSFLHITRAESDFPGDIDPYNEAVYEKALTNFQLFKTNRIIIEDSTPCLYVYRLSDGAHVQSGIMACCHINDYINNSIKKHENTREEKETDRAKLTSKLNAHTGPIFLTYKDQPDINTITSHIETEKPLYEARGNDGVLHTIWRVQDYRSIVEYFKNISAFYIADGHHRAAANLRVAMERREGSKQSGEEHNWFPVILFPASQLRVFPYNRCVLDLAGMTSETFLEAVRMAFSVKESSSANPHKKGHINMYLNKKWYDLSCPSYSSENKLPHKNGHQTCSSTNDPVSELDVSILQNKLLSPILGIHDPRTNMRIKNISGIYGTDVLQELVDSGKASAAFSMFPISVDQLIRISDMCGIMPPKSTWFAPKPLSGFIIHPF